MNTQLSAKSLQVYSFPILSMLLFYVSSCHGQTKQEQEGEGKMWFIVNCRLRIKAREQGGLYTGTKGRPARSPAEPEGIIWIRFIIRTGTDQGLDL